VEPIQSSLQNLTKKEMSRKEFLGILGLAIMSLFGMGTIIKLFTGKSFDKHFGSTVDGYGASVYGGTNHHHSKP
jgi:hypothetical protein